MPVPVIINSALAKKHATEKDPWAMEWLKSNEAGGGAYRLESWKPGQETVYARFDDWKSGPVPKIRRVIVREVPSAGNRRALIERGDADVSVDFPPKDVSRWPGAASSPWWAPPVENALIYLGMNAKQPALRQRQGAPGGRLRDPTREDLRGRDVRSRPAPHHADRDQHGRP